MSTATEESNKRIRIDSMANNSEATTKSPMAVATECLRTHCESLHHSAHKILLPLGTKHLKLITKRLNKEQELMRLERNPSMIPRSARIGFKLQGPKSAEDFDEFKKVSEETTIAVAQIQQSLRELTMKGLAALIKYYNKEIEKDMARGLFHLIETIRILEKKNLDTSAVASDLIARSFDKISTHFQTTRDEFIALYNECNNTNISHTLISQFDLPNTDNAVVLRWLDSIFIAPFAAYTRQQQNNDIALQLEELHSELTLTKKTDEAQMLVDEDLPADRTQLNELIKREAEKQTQALRQELNNLKNNMAKNGPPRGPKRSASKDKNKNRQQKDTPKEKDKDKDNEQNNNEKKKNNKKKGKGKADAQGNATTAENSNKKQNGSGKKSKKKTPNSRTASGN